MALEALITTLNENETMQVSRFLIICCGIRSREKVQCDEFNHLKLRMCCHYIRMSVSTVSQQGQTKHWL